MAASPPEVALHRAQDALAHTPAGLVTDLDGTLAEIVADPRAARPVPGSVEALATLATRLAVVAVVSGRAAGDVRALLGPVANLLVVGNHGLEWLAAGDATGKPAPGTAAIRASIRSVLARLPALDGVSVEDKGLSATIHYRAAPDPDVARRAILGALGASPASASASTPPLDVREGRRSIELRPRGAGDKGTAVRAIAERHALHGLVVAGDDTTDLDMFRAARDLGRRGVVTAVLAITGADEVPADVASEADAVLPGPAAFTALLAVLAAGTPGSISPSSAR